MLVDSVYSDSKNNINKTPSHVWVNDSHVMYVKKQMISHSKGEIVYMNKQIKSYRGNFFISDVSDDSRNTKFQVHCEFCDEA